MTALFQRLLFILAQFGQDELVRQIAYLKVENEILRSRVLTVYLAEVFPLAAGVGRPASLRQPVRHARALAVDYVGGRSRRRPISRSSNDTMIAGAWRRAFSKPSNRWVSRAHAAGAAKR
jgi:hypothetical protein